LKRVRVAWKFTRAPESDTMMKAAKVTYPQLSSIAAVSGALVIVLIG
jgi:hypothetical protein